MNKPMRHESPRPRAAVLKFLSSSHQKIRIKRDTSPRNLNRSSKILRIPDLNGSMRLKIPAMKFLGTSNNSLKGICLSNKLTNTLKSSNTLKNSPRKPSNLTPQQQFDRLSLPLSPKEALGYFSKYLPAYEIAEIPSFPQIFYLGFKTPKASSVKEFDDDAYDYRLFKYEHIAYRYEVLKILGKGSFGQVCHCIDHKTKAQVAVKIIKNKKKFVFQAGIEIQLLKSLKEQADKHRIVRILDAFEFRKHICISFELLGPNLYEVLKDNHFKGLPTGQLKIMSVQILEALSCIKRWNIIHCDLKPENILLEKNNKRNLKLIDFGSACLDREQIYTYIQSRFYRAPEVILGIPISFSIDMWSFGCVLAELCLGDAILQGDSEIEQLKLIVEMKGMPPSSLVERSPRKSKFFYEDGSLRSGRHKVSSLEIILKTEDYLLLDFLNKCLEWEPEKRITPELALGHPWITEIYTNRKL